MEILLRKDLLLLLFVFCMACSPGMWALDTDPQTVWPLCGRITANPPPGWNEANGCPAQRFGDASYSDEPLSSSFGPRPLASENNRYDFHRGIDIATPIGTPFFAIADGIVRIAGNDPAYSDPLVSLRHFPPGESGCSAQGCYHSYYMHVSNWVVGPGQAVVKGQLLGHTGASDSGFEHLHFEVRQARASDPFSAWSRDAVHPLSVVPYAVSNSTSLVFNAVDLSDPDAGRVDLTVVSNRFDLVFVGLTVFDANQQEVIQDGNTPDINGYHVLPPFFDMEQTNFMYSHKDSSAFPWSSFGAGGVNECPYHAEHGTSYDAQVHLDAQDPADYHDGLFNGLHVKTHKYWPSDVDDYEVRLEFLALQGPAVCVEASAVFASGNYSTETWGDCEAAPNLPPTAAFGWNCTDLDCSFSSSSSDPDGSIASQDWDFGDGGSATGAGPQHRYPAEGDWLVTLTVHDNEGVADSTSAWVHVNEPPVTTINLTLSTNSRRNQVSLRWNGATGSKVEIYRNGTLLANTKNDGSWNDRNVSKGNSYRYRVCEQGSNTLCSAEGEITL